MEEGRAGRSERIVEFVDDAAIDLVGIAITTQAIWGERQEKLYTDFLKSTFEFLLENPEAGDLIADSVEFAGYRVYLAKYRKRRTAHGHRIFYRASEGGILVVRILHTAMDWSEHL